MTGAAASPHPILHRREFLLLLIGKNRFDLAARLLHDRLRFGATVFLRRRLILAEGLHLLLAINQHRLDLALLIRGEVKLLRQPL